MEKTWQELRPQLGEALVDAFDEDRFKYMLQSRCRRALDHLTAREIRFPRKVHEVIDDAERNGWLDCLVQATREKNESHAKLQAVTADVLAGIKTEGASFYQEHIVDEAAGIEDEAVLLRQLENYLKTLQGRTSAVPLVSLDESGEIGKKLALERVFIDLNAGQQKSDQAGAGGGKERMTAAIAHLHDRPQLILLGDPGSGKSTLLRYAAFCLAGALRQDADEGWRERLAWPVYNEEGEIVERRRWESAAPVPVFVLLRDFARHEFDPRDSTALIDYVCEKLAEEDLAEAAEPLRELARRDRVLFLLDGVDEVPADERGDVWAAIAALGEGAYSGNRWVATCRILSFNKDEAPAGLQPETLQPLDERQISEFIDHWYEGLVEARQLGRDDALDKARTLQSEVRQRPDLGELAQNPMLLTIMALVQTFRTLPNERARLYQACVETLLLRWQMPKEGAEEGETLPDVLAALGVDQQKLERLLWEIAWQAHSEAITRRERADIKESEIMALAAKHLGGYGKAEQFLTYTEQRAHLLVGRGGIGERVYSFPHRTFQEYLAACYLESERRPLRRIAELAEEGDPWREVINLAFGRLIHVKNDRIKAIDIVIDKLLDEKLPADEAGWRRVWLTGEACAVIGKGKLLEDEEGAEVLPVIQEQLVALLEHEALTPQQRAEAGDALGKLGDPRPGVCTLEPDLIEIPAGDFLYGDQKETRTIEQPFAIARYPVTVAQFAKFMEDGGYEEPRWWGGEESAGWQWRQRGGYRSQGPVTQPQYWQQPRWHEENRPVVGVSWYEAVAYCAWLSEKSEREYRLPSELEWERAARHTDGRQFPWGDAWEDGIINSREVQIGRTTAAGAFPRGSAECGADDMSGNVWEWTASFYDNDQDTYVLRGGSWNLNRYDARVAFRLRDSPYDSYFGIGFRVVSPVS